MSGLLFSRGGLCVRLIGALIPGGDKILSRESNCPPFPYMWMDVTISPCVCVASPDDEGSGEGSGEPQEEVKKTTSVASDLFSEVSHLCTYVRK